MFASIIDATCTSLPVYVTYRPSIREVRTIHHIIMTPRRQNYRSRSMILIVANYSPPSRPFLQVLRQVSGASLRPSLASVCFLFFFSFFHALFDSMLLFSLPLSRININAKLSINFVDVISWFCIIWYRWINKTIVDNSYYVSAICQSRNKIARLQIYRGDRFLRCIRVSFGQQVFEFLYFANFLTLFGSLLFVVFVKDKYTYAGKIVKR